MINEELSEKPIKLPRESYEMAQRMDEKRKVLHLPQTHSFMNMNADVDADYWDDYFFGLTTDMYEV